MGYDAESARGLIRVSLGRFNTQQEIDRFLKSLRAVMAEIASVPHTDDRASEVPLSATLA